LSNSVAIDSPVIKQQGTWMAWLVCLSAGLFFFYEFFQLNLFDVINEPLRTSFNIDAAQLSWMSSTYLWADLLFLIPAGFILDRFSTRKVISIAMAICVMGTVGFALTESFALASFYHFISGIGNAFCFMSCIVLVSHWFPPSKRALVIGCVVTMAFIGGMMAHTPLAYLNAQYGWRSALLIDGAIGAVLFVWIWLVVEDRPYEATQTNAEQKNSPSNPWFKPFSNPQNWLAGAYTSLMNLPIMVLCALWGASYLEVVHHLPKMAASNVVSLLFIGSIFGCPLAGWMSDRMGRRKPLMIAGAIATLVCFAPFFLGVEMPKPILSALFFALGLFTSTQVITYPFVAESNDASITGAATGIASVIIMGGAGVAQVLFGHLIHLHATSAVYKAADFQYALWMFPVAILLALFAVMLTKETYCRTQP